MLRYFLLLCLLVGCCFHPGYAADKPQPRVMVTIPTYRYFVKKIAGDAVDVDLMVPVGTSSHTFEATPKQILKIQDVDLWFTTGEPFETRVLRALQSYNSKLQNVDLRRGVDMIAGGDCHCTHCACHPEGLDLHLWLSPRVAKQQVMTITEALKKRYPTHAAQFDKGSTELLKELETIDKQLSSTFSDGKKRLVVVSHPAFAYFGRDYNIEQLSVEIEGKDPTPRQLTQLIEKARKAGIKVIYTEPQYSTKGATLVAKQIGARLVQIDPYAEEYPALMQTLGREFSQAPMIGNDNAGH